MPAERYHKIIESIKEFKDALNAKIDQNPEYIDGVIRGLGVGTWDLANQVNNIDKKTWTQTTGIVHDSLKKAVQELQKHSLTEGQKGALNLVGEKLDNFPTRLEEIAQAYGFIIEDIDKGILEISKNVNDAGGWSKPLQKATDDLNKRVNAAKADMSLLTANEKAALTALDAHAAALTNWRDNKSGNTLNQEDTSVHDALAGKKPEAQKGNGQNDGQQQQQQQGQQQSGQQGQQQQGGASNGGGAQSGPVPTQEEIDKKAHDAEMRQQFEDAGKPGVMASLSKAGGAVTDKFAEWTDDVAGDDSSASRFAHGVMDSVSSLGRSVKGAFQGASTNTQSWIAGFGGAMLAGWGGMFLLKQIPGIGTMLEKVPFLSTLVSLALVWFGLLGGKRLYMDHVNQGSGANVPKKLVKNEEKQEGKPPELKNAAAIETNDAKNVNKDNGQPDEQQTQEKNEKEPHGDSAPDKDDDDARLFIPCQPNAGGAPACKFVGGSEFDQLNNVQLNAQLDAQNQFAAQEGGSNFVARNVVVMRPINYRFAPKEVLDFNSVASVESLRNHDGASAPNVFMIDANENYMPPTIGGGPALVRRMGIGMAA